MERPDVYAVWPCIDDFKAEHAEVAGTTNGITTMAQNRQEVRQWTNLSGQRVGAGYHGIVIGNGIKVFRK